MSPSPEDPVAIELHALRQTLETLTQRVVELATENQQLREQLEHSQTARTDLVAQTEHVIGLLANARQQLRDLEHREPAG